jgi:AraC-like DNA-binding protein
MNIFKSKVNVATVLLIGLGVLLLSAFLPIHPWKLDVINLFYFFAVLAVQFLLIVFNNRQAKKRNASEHDAETEEIFDLQKVQSPINQNDSKIIVVEDNDELRKFIVEELSKLELRKKENNHLNNAQPPIFFLAAQPSDKQKKEGANLYDLDENPAKPFNFDFLLLRIAYMIEQKNWPKDKFFQKIEVNPKDITITSMDEQLIEKALNLIEINMDNSNYSVQQFSLDMSMDRTVLYKKLQLITGMSPSDFIRSIRIKRAAFLLSKGQYPVGEVADRVGFNTPRYFSKHFKDAFGVTPSQYVHGAR